MKNLSRWANRHVRLAIALIVFAEVANGFNGVMLGATLLSDVPTATLYVGTALVMIFATDVRRMYCVGPDTAGFRQWCLVGAFGGNFLLFGLVGGLLVPARPNRANLPARWATAGLTSGLIRWFGPIRCAPPRRPLPQPT